MLMIDFKFNQYILYIMEKKYIDLFYTFLSYCNIKHYLLGIINHLLNAIYYKYFILLLLLFLLFFF